MGIYELTHVFFRYSDNFVLSPKKLGLFYTLNSVQKAIQYYNTQPGFCENQDAFSVRERPVYGSIIDDTVFEVIIYFHSEDYEFEAEIEIGLYGDETTAQDNLSKYCRDNPQLFSSPKLVLEKIVNKCVIGKKEWLEGFSIYE